MSILDFLGNIFGGGSGGNSNMLSSLTKLIPATVSNFKGVDIGPQKQLLSQMGNVSNAEYNTANPLYQQLYGQQKQQQQQNLASQIAEMQRQNRGQIATGRTPLFSGERGGEQIFRGLNQANQGADLTAANNARGILSGTLGGLNTTMNSYNNVSKLQQGNTTSQNMGFNDIGNFLRSQGL